jgi:hypothetical protein
LLLALQNCLQIKGRRQIRILPEIQPKNCAAKLYMMQEATLTAIYFLIKIKLKNLMLQKMNSGEIHPSLHKLSILVTSSMYQPETPK